MLLLELIDRVFPPKTTISRPSSNALTNKALQPQINERDSKQIRTTKAISILTSHLPFRDDINLGEEDVF